jgi:hypothetical protein
MVIFWTKSVMLCFLGGKIEVIGYWIDDRVRFRNKEEDG